MIIRVDKCSTFAIKKALTKSIQYLPKLLINNCPVPTVKIGESFKYLARFFGFNMSNKKHKLELISLVNELMSDIDLAPLHLKNKLLLYSRYILSKISWHFTVASLLKTWIVENVDPVINKYIRKWLEIPISGTLSNIFSTRNKFGLNIILASMKFTQWQTVQRNALETSPNEAIKELWKLTNNIPMFNTIFIIQQKKFPKISVLDKKTNYSPSWFVKVLCITFQHPLVCRSIKTDSGGGGPLMICQCRGVKTL